MDIQSSKVMYALIFTFLGTQFKLDLIPLTTKMFHNLDLFAQAFYNTTFCV
jgi:hypothetical protein